MLQMSVPSSDTSMINFLNYYNFNLFSKRLLSYLRCDDLSSVCKITLSAKCFDTSHKRLLPLYMAFMINKPVFILSAV